MWKIFERNRPFVYIEKVLNLWVQFMKNGGKNKSVVFIILVSVYCGRKSKQQIQWVWPQASERLLLNRNNKIKVSKGAKVFKINSGSGVLVMLRGLWRRGSVLEGRVQVRGGVRRLYALPSEVRGARSVGFSSGFVYLLAHGARRDWSVRHPSPTAISWVQFCPDGSHLWQHGSPSTLLSWTREDTSVHARGIDRTLEERGARYLNSSGDEALFGSGAPHHMPPALAVSVPLLSHTPTPIGSLVNKGRGGDERKV